MKKLILSVIVTVSAPMVVNAEDLLSPPPASFYVNEVEIEVPEAFAPFASDLLVSAAKQSADQIVFGALENFAPSLGDPVVQTIRPIRQIARAKFASESKPL